jgi:hypothetical protein
MVAVAGMLGDRAPGWVPVIGSLPLAALFVWVGVTSWLLRGTSRIEAYLLGLGLVATVSFAVTALLPLLPSSLVPPLSTAAIFLWLSFPAWLLAVAVRFWSRPSS